ncbi:DUF6600 domain-containing protein [Algoriphagus pacificus]|uniref:DUF6600 domain-containing protein n=1 Tax=Algoriphagus pacificus TaxID=2811234 RepID=UPI001F2F74BC|nr:DUF6600 domain-containing protein [Algoriphagus pacificus]
MKQKNLKLGLASTLVLVFAFSLFAPKQSLAETPYGVSFQVFYDELMPYGDWVKDANYGYIWLPAVNQDFHPYGTNGHWVMTEYGNTWVSYYDWGWAPFHYGRWYFDDFYQSWAWIPGYDWGPAWVNWRTGGGYYGWAPLGPGVSISVRVNIPSFHWVFLPSHRIYHQYAYRYYAPRKTKIRIYNNTTVINNTVVYNNNRYVAGPNRREVERVTRQNVPVYSVRGSNKPGRAAVSRNGLEIYRPDLTASRGRTVEARPSRSMTSDQARTARSQSRDTYSSSPSRSAREGISSGSRSASPTTRGTENGNRNSSPSRSATPSQRGGSFETKPYEGNRTSPTSPSTRNRETRPQSASPRTQSSPATRQSTERSGGARTSAPTTRTQESRPQNGSRTQQSPTVRSNNERSTGARTSQPTTRTQQSRTPSAARTKSAPTVRSSGSSQSRTSSKSAPARTSTPTSRKSSSGTTQRSTSRTRGNN